MDCLTEIYNLKDIIRDLGLHLDYSFLYDSVHCVRVWAQVPGKTTRVEITTVFSAHPELVWRHLQKTLSGLDYSWSNPDRGIDEFRITLLEFKTAKELKMKLELQGK